MFAVMILTAEKTEGLAPPYIMLDLWEKRRNFKIWDFRKTVILKNT